MRSVTTLARSPEFDLCEWCQSRQIYLDQLGGRVSDTFRWVMTSSRGFPTWVRCCVEIPYAGLRHTVTSAERNACIRLLVKLPLLLSDFNQNSNLSTNFSKTPNFKLNEANTRSLSTSIFERAVPCRSHSLYRQLFRLPLTNCYNR
jgi:hypothetical protein